MILESPIFTGLGRKLDINELAASLGIGILQLEINTTAPNIKSNQCQDTIGLTNFPAQLQIMSSRIKCVRAHTGAMVKENLTVR